MHRENLRGQQHRWVKIVDSSFGAGNKQTYSFCFQNSTLEYNQDKIKRWDYFPKKHWVFFFNQTEANHQLRSMEQYKVF